MITVRTSDDHLVTLHADVAQRFVTVAVHMTGSPGAGKRHRACPSVNVSYAMMETVLDFCRMQDAATPMPTPIVKMPLSSNVMADIVSEPFVSYMDELSAGQVCELAEAAQSLGFDALLDLCVVKIATLLKDRSAREILDAFGVSDLPDLPDLPGQRFDHL